MLASSGDLEALLRDQPHGGRQHERESVARHLACRGLAVGGDQVSIVNGAQQGLAVTVMALLRPGDVVATDALTYPGFKVLAQAQRLELAPIPTAEQGPDPDALERLCLSRPVRAVYAMPTLHNPLGWVMSAQRRQRLVAIARRHGLLIIEDVADAFLAEDPPAPLARSDMTRIVPRPALAGYNAVGLPLMPEWHCDRACPRRRRIDRFLAGRALRVESAASIYMRRLLRCPYFLENLYTSSVNLPHIIMTKTEVLYVFSFSCATSACAARRHAKLARADTHVCDAFDGRYRLGHNTAAIGHARVRGRDGIHAHCRVRPRQPDESLALRWQAGGGAGDGGCHARPAGRAVRAILHPATRPVRASGATMIIAIANPNGAVRGSFLGNNLGLLRARSGRKVLLIDTDPRKPLCAWSGARRAADIQPRVLARAIIGNGLQAELENLLPRYNDIVINTEQRDTLEGRAALIAARLVIVPVRPGQVDLARQYQLIARLNSARMFNPGLHVLFVIVSSSSAPSDEELAAIRAYVSRVMAAKLASTVIHEQPPSLSGQGRGIGGSDAGQAEMNALYGEIYAK